MQTPLQAPICLWAYNQETNDMANSHTQISHPGSGSRLQAYFLHRLKQRQMAALQPLKDRASNKGGGRSWAHITRDRNPADTLLTWGHRWKNRGWDPWDILTPQCLETTSPAPDKRFVQGWLQRHGGDLLGGGGLVSGDLTVGEGGWDLMTDLYCV